MQTEINKGPEAVISISTPKTSDQQILSKIKRDMS